VKAEVAKLEFLRSMGADSLDLSGLPAERRRFLATVGRRLTAQALERRDPQRRYPILLTRGAVGDRLLDEVVQLFDQAISALGVALGELEEVLAAGDGPVRLDEAGDLVIPPLTAEDVPAEATALKAELTEMPPRSRRSCRC
jgi:hypothetical protein